MSLLWNNGLRVIFLYYEKQLNTRTTNPKCSKLANELSLCSLGAIVSYGSLASLSVTFGSSQRSRKRKRKRKLQILLYILKEIFKYGKFKGGILLIFRGLVFCWIYNSYWLMHNILCIGTKVPWWWLWRRSWDKENEFEAVADWKVC